jgi:predicted DNA-binding protein (MmcQ/YjbR family)
VAAKRKTSVRRPPRGSGLRRAQKELRDYALGFPGATEHFPWGERVAKVNGKIFVAFGCDPGRGPEAEMQVTVKLPLSCEEALELPFTEPTGYGLGKAGWVSARFAAKDAPPIGILKAWIEESYKAVSPKKMLEQLEGSRKNRPTPTGAPPADRPARRAARGSGSPRPRSRAGSR